jgi:hypothetical protein
MTDAASASQAEWPDVTQPTAATDQAEVPSTDPWAAYFAATEPEASEVEAVATTEAEASEAEMVTSEAEAAAEIEPLASETYPETTSYAEQTTETVVDAASESDWTFESPVTEEFGDASDEGVEAAVVEATAETDDSDSLSVEADPWATVFARADAETEAAPESDATTSDEATSEAEAASEAEATSEAEAASEADAETESQVAPDAETPEQLPLPGGFPATIYAGPEVGLPANVVLRIELSIVDEAHRAAAARPLTVQQIADGPAQNATALPVDDMGWPDLDAEPTTGSAQPDAAWPATDEVGDEPAQPVRAASRADGTGGPRISTIEEPQSEHWFMSGEPAVNAVGGGAGAATAHKPGNAWLSFVVTGVMAVAVVILVFAFVQILTGLLS